MSEKYNCVYYKASENPSIERALKNGQYGVWEETYGYSSTMDAFTNFISALDLFNTVYKNDLRFVWTIDGVKYPECNYEESGNLLDRSYDYFSIEKRLNQFTKA